MHKDETNKENKMKNTEQNEKDISSITSAVAEGEEKISMPELTEDSLPTKEELASMTVDERAELYKKIVCSVDRAVEGRVSNLAQEYQRGIADLQDASVRGAFSSSEKFSGFGESIAAIDTLIEKVPVLKSLPADQKYTVAYLINEGIKARESREAMSAESLVALISARPDAMRLYDAQRTQELAESYKSTPAFAASGGSSVMPANIKSTPRNIDEASREAYSSFGIKI